MPYYDCMICGKTIKNGLKCSTCKAASYDTNSDWYKALKEGENNLRAMYKKEDYHGSGMTFSDVQSAGKSGWDLIENYSPNPYGYDPEYIATFSKSVRQSLLRILMADCSITDGERRALSVYVDLSRTTDKARFNDVAQILSQNEGRKVSPQAARRRKSDALKKIKNLYHEKTYIHLLAEYTDKVIELEKEHALAHETKDFRKIDDLKHIVRDYEIVIDYFSELL